MTRKNAALEVLLISVAIAAIGMASKFLPAEYLPMINGSIGALVIIGTKSVWHCLAVSGAELERMKSDKGA